jgi:hypothetical protein
MNLINPSTLPSVAPCEISALPRKAGVYFVVHKEINILYIGQSRDIRSRWAGREMLLLLDYMGETRIHFHVPDVPRDVEPLELQFISAYSPILNQKTPTGPRFEREKVVEAILGHAYQRRGQTWAISSLFEDKRLSKVTSRELEEFCSELVEHGILSRAGKLWGLAGTTPDLSSLVLKRLSKTGRLVSTLKIDDYLAQLLVSGTDEELDRFDSVVFQKVSHKIRERFAHEKEETIARVMARMEQKAMEAFLPNVIPQHTHGASREEAEAGISAMLRSGEWKNLDGETWDDVWPEIFQVAAGKSLEEIIEEAYRSSLEELSI